MILLSTAYFPPVEWVAWALRSPDVQLEAEEHFVKQTYRSRCHIAGPNGLQKLTVPVDRSERHIRRIKISYAEDWVKDHLKAIESAYANAPFFEVLFPDIASILLSKPNTLWELNSKTINLYANWLEVDWNWPVTKAYTPEPGILDLRGIGPKRESSLSTPSYPQVFSYKNAFENNLSAMDVFFNLGRSSWDYFLECQPRT